MAVAGKYAPLGAHLARAAAHGETQVEMLFVDVARLVGGLPSSALRERTWWANSSHSQAQAWRSAGWHVEAVDLPGQKVEFVTGTVGGSFAARGRVPADESTRSSRPSIDLSEAVEDARVTVSFTWFAAGQIVLDRNGGLAFPRLPRSPGLYRMTLHDAPGQVRPRVYIGESKNLRDRSNGYRNPTPRQQTSHRMNGILIDHLTRGGTVSFAATTSCAVELGHGTVPLDLTRKAGRLLAESAALAIVYDRGGVDVENLG